jgi:hypothetical protein
MTNIVITLCDAQKTKEKLKSSTRMCQIWHVLAQSSADIQGFNVFTCLYLSVKVVCLIRIFPHHPLKTTFLIAVPTVKQTEGPCQP